MVVSEMVFSVLSTATTEEIFSSSLVGPRSVTSAGAEVLLLRMLPSAMAMVEVSAVTGSVFSLTSSKTTLTVVGFSTVTLTSLPYSLVLAMRALRRSVTSPGPFTLA